MAPERIHFLKFILEGYDGLAMQSTVDLKDGIVLLRFPPEMADDVAALLNDIAPAIGLDPKGCGLSKAAQADQL